MSQVLPLNVIPEPQTIATMPPKQSKPTNPTKESEVLPKTEWKKLFNEAIRAAKSLEKSQQYSQALWQYAAAKSIVSKPKIDTKIIKLRKICIEQGSHLSANALKPVSHCHYDPNKIWHYNVVTDCYHIKPTQYQSNGPLFGDYIIPAVTFCKLYDYQRDALVWFWSTYQSPNGGILGDDMGLGKTGQTSAYLNGAFHSGFVRCVLLIVPVSMMSHWSNELAFWCQLPSGYRIKKYHSSLSEKRRQENLEYIARRGGILVTSYGMIQKNYTAMNMEILSQQIRDGRLIQRGSPWDYMILDEGHMVKNESIGISQAVRAIPVRRSNRILLSGTFLQNELSELWSLFDFISEGALFGSQREFNEKYATKINLGRMKNATQKQKQLSVALTNSIKQKIAPFLLRRMKHEVIANEKGKAQENGSGVNGENKKEKSMSPVLDCEKRELVVWIKMTNVQTNIYRSFLESEEVKEALNTTKSPLSAITVLKKICNNPFLLSDEQNTVNGKERLVDRETANILRTSAKMVVLSQLLKQLITQKHRVLVFSGYKLMLSTMEPILKEIGMKYIRMDGDTKVEDRQKYVDTFNTSKDIDVFLLSTKVGGLGLNLTGSDRVIIFDPSWNPANDAQAVDRSYRIGQVNDVMVHRFVTCGTVEETIYRRQISKVGLLKSMTGDSNQQRYFSESELKEVFQLKDPTISQTQLQLKQLHQHTVGVNVEFDRETADVEAFDNVYGVSHHDLLFQSEEAMESARSQLAKVPYFEKRKSRISGRKRKRSESDCDWIRCQEHGLRC